MVFQGVWRRLPADPSGSGMSGGDDVRGADGRGVRTPASPHRQLLARLYHVPPGNVS